MTYPTGNNEGRSVICMNECRDMINEALCECNESCVLECLTKWLDENEYCVECSQLNEYLNECGYKMRVDEDMAAPAPGLATPANVNGMGNPATPTNGGTNAGFYDATKVGSGDRFDAVASRKLKTSKKGKKSNLLKKFEDFIGKGKM